MHRPSRPIRRGHNGPNYFHVGINQENCRLDGIRVACYESYSFLQYKATINVGTGFTVSGCFFCNERVVVLGIQTYRFRSQPYEMILRLPTPVYRHNLQARVEGENIVVTCQQVLL